MFWEEVGFSLQKNELSQVHGGEHGHTAMQNYRAFFCRCSRMSSVCISSSDRCSETIQ